MSFIMELFASPGRDRPTYPVNLIDIHNLKTQDALAFRIA
jgi:hypothetical protein